MACKPAARYGDQTAHGGKLVPGARPTTQTYICGALAAGVSDDHRCPGRHRRGLILPPCAQSVLIEGKAAARIGDLCECMCGSVDPIVSGCQAVLIGDSPYEDGGGEDEELKPLEIWEMPAG